MQKKIIQLCYLGVISLSLESCFVTTQLPNVVNIPILEHPKEVHLSGYLGADHSEVQGAYSLNGTSGVLLNTYFGYPDYYPNTYLLEGGYGGSKMFKEKSFFELYAGYGYGRKNFSSYKEQRTVGIPPFSFKIPEDEVFIFSTEHHRFFIQPTIGLKELGEAKRRNSISFSLKTTWQYYIKYHYLYQLDNYQNGPPSIIKYSNVNAGNACILTLEPTLNLRVQIYKPLYLNTQVGSAFAFGNNTIIQNMFHSAESNQSIPVYTRIGLYLILNSSN